MSVLCGCFGGDCKGEAREKTDGRKGAPLPYDPDFKGPIRGKARRPKDLLCLGIFLAFIIGMLTIAIFAWVNGTPERIVYPTDSRGRLCGKDSGVEDRPYLLFFDLKQCAAIITLGELLSGDFSASAIFTCPTPQVCVSECPEENEFGVRPNPVCVDGVDTSRFENLSSDSIDLLDLTSLTNTAGLVRELLDLISDEKCAPYYLDSTPVARRCVPTLVDLDDQVEEVFFNASDDLNAVAANQSLGDLLLTVNAEAIINGSFTQALLVESRQFLLDVYRDLQIVWPGLIIGVGVAMFFSLVYIISMWFCAGVIVWGSIVACLLFVAGISGFSYYQFYCLQESADIFSRFNPNSTTLVEFLNTTETLAGQICLQTSAFREFIDTELPWSEYQEETWLAIGIMGSVFLVIVVILLIFLGKKIRISIAIIQEASKAVVGVPTSVFYPLVTWVLLFMLFFYWGIVALFLLTSSEETFAIIMNGTLSEEDRNISGRGIDGVVFNGLSCDPEEFGDTIFVIPGESESGMGPVDLNVTNVSISCQFDQFFTSNTLLGLQIYHLFGLFWISNYIIALGECTLAGAFASWYWAFRKPKDVPRFAVWESFWRAVLFHSGSLAFGALIIAIIQLIRAILTYLQKKLKGKTGRIAQALLCMLQCCFWCLEKILRYINRQAYIEIAIYGYDFCTAACKAIKLLLRNIITTAVKDRIVDFLLFLGKIAIVSGVGIVAYLGFGPYRDLGTSIWGEPLNYYLLPIMFLVLAAYLIASGFLSVYHMAVDTIFICALEDLERNNGYDKPYFMSDRLKKLLNVDNKVEHPDAGGDLQMESLESVAENT